MCENTLTTIDIVTKEYRKNIAELSLLLTFKENICLRLRNSGLSDRDILQHKDFGIQIATYIFLFYMVCGRGYFCTLCLIFLYDDMFFGV